MIWFSPFKRYGLDLNDDGSWFLAEYPIDPVVGGSVWELDGLTHAEAASRIRGLGYDPEPLLRQAEDA
jgi:hypothetical protein